MIVKNCVLITSVVSCLLLSIHSEVQAQSIDSYEDYKLYCSRGAFDYGLQSPDCSQYKDTYENRPQEELKQQDTRQEENTHSQTNNNNSEAKTKNIRGYVGGSLGAFFPTNDLDLLNLDDDSEIDEDIEEEDINESDFELDLDTGFGGSLFLGAMFNNNVGTDLEFILFGGGTEIDDLNYSEWGIFFNPRFIQPLSKQNNVAVFLSPGLGLSKGKLSTEISDELAEELGVEQGLELSVADDISFTLQVKLGLTFKLADKYEGFTQVRYVHPIGDYTIDTISPEVGLLVNF
ncbi:hypothetical protein Sta7437_0611 [Stanieria cyanosphaera PCC 7437]|uniref:Uncharacterized protein n=1 Tax=Stanieria cyanosphaera (strain ATCC 29371 / PCC 7437) TaxID=111780 RepID=K9XQ36_STAC7|nr:outer membrane beta-barrel protein [Stanieria cyanosphaera]AFZ34209.1 hypothetical protein Sta7437_0611 [Stanieria cyanosphaera PCC 7437]